MRTFLPCEHFVGRCDLVIGPRSQRFSATRAGNDAEGYLIGELDPIPDVIDALDPLESWRGRIRSYPRVYFCDDALLSSGPRPRGGWLPRLRTARRPSLRH